MDRILIIDGYNAIHRANIKFSFKPKDDEKEPQFVTVFNFFRNLRPIIEQFQPDKCFFALEGHSKFRYALYPEYKANRILKFGQDKKDKFYEDANFIIELLKLFPVTLVKAADYEADDVIATLAADLKNEDVTILSNDTDFIQLLQLGYKNIKIYNPIKKTFQVAPDYHYVAMKSLAGDKSDNIKGLVGKKKAETLVTNTDKFQAFMAVEENRANFGINKQLIEFQAVPLEELILEEGFANWDLIFQRFTEMEFNSIVNENSWKKFKDTFDCIKF